MDNILSHVIAVCRASLVFILRDTFLYEGCVQNKNDIMSHNLEDCSDNAVEAIKMIYVMHINFFSFSVVVVKNCAFPGFHMFLVLVIQLSFTT